MNCYDYMVQVKLGIPQTQIFSNNLVDLKTHYYAESLNDEQKFQAMVKATKIQTEKSWDKWRWDVILELLEGNLITQPRLEALYKNKFTKRLLKFYLPEKLAFIKLPWNKENLIYAKCGYLLIKRLVHDKRGRRVLSSEEELI
jgi:rapamycin-insensitive companion of mTOR